MSRPNTTFTKKTRLFSPSFTRHLTSQGAAVKDLTSANLSGSNLEASASFRYDPIGAPLRSTQQLPVDWSDFSKHTFFNSAESKVNIAFDRIINNYPFDGTKDEYIEYVDSLTGFEKYVLDLFPKNTGFINLGGVDSNGDLLQAHVIVKDNAGSFDPVISKNNTGNTILDSKFGSITFEFFIFAPSGVEYIVSDQSVYLPSGDRPIIQRLTSDGSQGIGIYLLSGSSVSSTETLQMIVSSGSLNLSASFEIDKDEWVHASCQLNRTPGINKLQLYKNGNLVATSNSAEIGDFGYADRDLLIGSGTIHYFTGSADQAPQLSINCQEIFSGSLDELRIFHTSRSALVIRQEMHKNIFSRDSLKLYYKFNEPHGDYASADLLLDSSGNSLHSRVVNYSSTVRDSAGLTNPVLYEDENANPVLFPGNQTLIDLNTNLLTSASIYDVNNPNLITKLIPQHYLQEAAIFEGLKTDTSVGDAGDPYGYDQNIPGGGRMGSPQIIASLLFLWAKQFDEIKMYLDQFGKLMNVDVIEEGSIADNFLPFVADYYGLTLPRIVDNASIEQLVGNDSLTTAKGNSQNSIKKIQHVIWRRILADINEIIASKGTHHSIRSLLLNMGINPNNNFRFKEFGGAKTRKISDAREIRSVVAGMLDMSGTYASKGIGDAQGRIDDAPFLVTQNLFDDRVEPGFPPLDDSGSDIQNGMLTSGSWSYEAIYKFQGPSKNNIQHEMSQSLVRLCSTGSAVPNLIYANLVALSGSEDHNITGTLLFYARPQPNQQLLVMPITGVNIFDGNKWHITFGRQRNDSLGNDFASSYFLRAARTVNGKIIDYYSTSSLFNDHDPASINIFEKIDSDYNANGLFAVVGKQKLPSSLDDSYGTTAGVGALNDTDVGNELNCSTIFGGKISRIRFWSKGLTEIESREHAMNIESLGVVDPITNFNFNKTNDGSFERLRIDASIDQPVTESSTSGLLDMFDFSQNQFHISGSGFASSARIIKPENFEFSILSPHFESSTSNNKVRVRSFLNEKNVQAYGASHAPLYNIPANESPKDDTRFSVEVSLVQALNEDIINIFATLDTFDNIVGDPASQFSGDYKDLSFISDIYFKRLNKKINVSRYFDFFKWFDTTIGDTIENLLPRKTKFLGSNFVIEQHVLERAKFSYNNYDMYIGPNDRYGLKGQILLQQFIAEILRF
jgi:hypothetical protein